MHFECSFCTFCDVYGPLSYWDFIKHKLKCENSYALTQFKCPYTCVEAVHGKVQPQFQGFYGLIDHFNSTCSKSIVECNKCSYRVLRGKNNYHQCLSDLKAQLKKEKLELEAQKWKIGVHLDKNLPVKSHLGHKYCA